MMRGKLVLAAALMVGAVAVFAADTRRPEVPIGLKAREAAEKSLRACYVDCRQRSADATALEDCMITCNTQYPHATSLQPKSERLRR